MFTLLKRQKKIIYHAGAWEGNFGDSIIHKSIQSSLSQCSKYKIEFRNINCQQIEFTKDLIEEINREGDLLVIGGGGLVFYRPQDNSKSGWQWNIDIDLIDMIKVPFVVYGIGYNQFEYDNSNFIPVTNSHLQKTVNLSTLFSVRDTGTKRELIARGCDENKIEVIPDSGMFLPANKIKVPGLRHGKLKVGINWTSDRENQTFPEPWAQNREHFIKNLAGLCRHLIDKRNAQIFYISHMGSSFDKRIVDSLRELLGGNLIVIEEVLSSLFPANYEKAEKLVGVYRQMDIVLGMRGHANIVSFGQHVPFIPFGSHRKNRYLLEDIGESRYYIDVRKPELCTKERMVSLVEDLLNERNSYMERHERVYVVMREKFDSFNRRVLSLIDKQYERCPLCGKDPVFYTRTNRYGIYRDVVICRDCELIYLSPPVRDREHDELYNETYRKLYECPSVPDEAFHAERTPSSLYRIGYIKKNACLGKETSLLDIGCGGGTFLMHLKKEGIREMMGVEIEPNYSAYIEKELGINVIKRRLEDLDLNKAFDIITMWHVLEHIWNLDKALSVVRRLLKNTGKLSVEVPLIFDIKKPPKDKITFQIAHNYYFTRKSLHKVLRMAGFKVLTSEVTPMNFFIVSCRKIRAE